MTHPIGTRLLLRTNGGYGYDGDLDAAFITIDSDFLGWARSLRDGWKAAYDALPPCGWLHHTLEVVLDDATPDFISQDDADLDHLFTDLADNTEALLEEGDESPTMAQDVDGLEVHVTYQGLYWTARPRHSDVGVETTLITWESLGFPKPEIAP